MEDHPKPVRRATVKITIGAICLTAVMASLPSAAADMATINWSLFHNEPKPSSQLSVRENLDVHLHRVDRSLSLLQSNFRKPRHGSAPDLSELSSVCRDRLKEANQFLELCQDNPE